MTQEGASGGFVNEKFSFSLAIIVSLILGALSLSHYLETNTTYLQLQIVQLETKQAKADAKNNSEKKLKKTITILKKGLIWVVYVVIIPTLIVTLVLITFFFFLQIIFRGMWFYVRDFAEEALYTRAASRLDRLAQAFYSFSFTLLVVVSTTLLCLMAWFAGGALIGFVSIYSKEASIYLLFLIGPGWLAWREYRERRTRPKRRTVLRVAFLLVFAGGLFLFFQDHILFPLLVFLGAVFVLTLRAILRYVGRVTGAFCLFHSVSLPVSPNSNRRRLLGRRLGIAVAVVMILALFTWADYQIVNASHTLEIDVDKRIYLPGESSVITITRGGLLQGKPSLECGYRDSQNKALKKRIYPEAHEEDIATLKYFLDLAEVCRPEGEGGEVIVELIAGHDKAGLFGQIKVESKTYLKVLAKR